MEERRFVTIGMSTARRVLILAHTERGNAVRIISARKATLRQRKQYEENS